MSHKHFFGRVYKKGRANSKECIWEMKRNLGSGEHWWRTEENSIYQRLWRLRAHKSLQLLLLWAKWGAADRFLTVDLGFKKFSHTKCHFAAGGKLRGSQWEGHDNLQVRKADGFQLCSGHASVQTMNAFLKCKWESVLKL